MKKFFDCPCPICRFPDIEPEISLPAGKVYFVCTNCHSRWTADITAPQIMNDLEQFFVLEVADYGVEVVDP